MGKLEEQVKLLGMELGFDSVGITSADDFYFDEQAAVNRVREGLLDGMNWITEERMRRSARPKELLPGAKSVISLAMSYYNGDFERGDLTKPNETTSVTTTINKAPLSWAASAIGARSCNRPKKSGFCITMQAVLSSIKLARFSFTNTLD